MEARKWYNKDQILKMKKEYSDAIDPYTQYIDNFRQMKIAEENNQNLRKLVKFCDKILNEMNKFEEELKQNKILTNIEYSKGYFRILRDKYYYQKVNL